MLGFVIFGYILPMLVLMVNGYLEYKVERHDGRLDANKTFFLIIVVSLMPFVNFLAISMLLIAAGLKIFETKKTLNEYVRCKECGLIQRRYQADKDMYSEKIFKEKEHQCASKVCKGKEVEEIKKPKEIENINKVKLKFAPKIKYSQIIKGLLTLKESKVYKELKEKRKEEKELEKQKLNAEQIRIEKEQEEILMKQNKILMVMEIEKIRNREEE